MQNGGICPASDFDHNPPEELKNEFRRLSLKAEKAVRRYSFAASFLSNPAGRHRRALRLAGRFTEQMEVISCSSDEPETVEQLIAMGIESRQTGIGLLRWSLYPDCAEAEQRVVPPDLPECQYLWKDGSGKLPSPEKFKLGLIRALTGNLQPVDVGFCANVFKDSSFVGVASGEKKEVTEECSRHHALVVGMRPNPDSGKCEFLVQNAYGNASQRVWVDGDVISRNTFVLEWLADATTSPGPKSK